MRSCQSENSNDQTHSLPSTGVNDSPEAVHTAIYRLFIYLTSIYLGLIHTRNGMLLHVACHGLYAQALKKCHVGGAQSRGRAYLQQALVRASLPVAPWARVRGRRVEGVSTLPPDRTPTLCTQDSREFLGQQYPLVR